MMQPEKAREFPKENYGYSAIFGEDGRCERRMNRPQKQTWGQLDSNQRSRKTRDLQSAEIQLSSAILNTYQSNIEMVAVESVLRIVLKNWLFLLGTVPPASHFSAFADILPNGYNRVYSARTIYEAIGVDGIKLRGFEGLSQPCSGCYGTRTLSCSEW